MCGIFGIITTDANRSIIQEIRCITDDLFKISESRGKDASGIAIHYHDNISILKGPIKSSKLIKTSEYQKFWDVITTRQLQKEHNSPVVVLGHSRMATNGSQENNWDNQPMVKNSIIGVFNGIITNEGELWEKNPDIPKQTTTDTEILFGLINKFFAETNNIQSALDRVFSTIEGAASFGIISDNSDFLVLATNNGSLYSAWNTDRTVMIFTSEKSFLRQIIKKYSSHLLFGTPEIFQVKPNIHQKIHLKNISLQLKENIEVINEKIKPSEGNPLQKYPVFQYDVIPERTINATKSPHKQEVLNISKMNIFHLLKRYQKTNAAQNAYSRRHSPL